MTTAFRGVPAVLASLVCFAAAIGYSGLSEAQASVPSPAEVVRAYRQHLEALKPAATASLFAPDADIFEGGSAEGSPAQYLSHHLTPEFGQFKSFQFSGVTQKVDESGDVAWISEKYHYRIVLKADGRSVESQGVATYVLRRLGGGWRIQVLHASSRKAPTNQQAAH